MSVAVVVVVGRISGGHLPPDPHDGPPDVSLHPSSYVVVATVEPGGVVDRGRF